MVRWAEDLIAEIGLLGVALLVAAVVWGTPRLRLFPLHEIQVTHALQEVRQSDVEQSLSDVLRGNFFTVDIEALRRAVEQLPWVRRAEVWRKWPSRIEVRIEDGGGAPRTRLTVLEHRVEATPRGGGAPLVVDAGQHTVLSAAAQLTASTCMGWTANSSAAKNAAWFFPVNPLIKLNTRAAFKACSARPSK